MKFLALDTSSPWTILALGDDGTCLVEHCFLAKQNQSSLLFPLIEELLKKTSLEISDLEAFAVVTGPGSFTGLRVGIATMKGFSFGTDKPVAALHALEFSAAASHEECVAPTVPSRRGYVFAAIYKKTPSFTTLLQPAEYPLDVFQIHVTQHGATVTEPTSLSGQDLIRFAWQHFQQSKTTDAFGLTAVYLIDEVAKVKGTL